MARRRVAGGGVARGGARRVGRTRLQPARRGAARGGARRGAARLAGGPAVAAGRRAVHRGGGRLLRVRRPSGGGRHERAAGRLAGRPRVARPEGRARARGGGGPGPGGGRRVASRIGLGSPAEMLAPGRAAEWNQAAMELGATVCTARAPRCEACPVAPWCASAGAPVAAVARRASPERFEDSNRWVRGRVVAALAAGEGVPVDIAPERLERAVAGLLHDGLVRRAEDGLALG